MIQRYQKKYKMKPEYFLKMKLLTSPEIALLQIPQEKLQPKPSILSQLFGKKQKNKAPHKWLPDCLHQLLSTFSISDVHC